MHVGRYVCFVTWFHLSESDIYGFKIKHVTPPPTTAVTQVYTHTHTHTSILVRTLIGIVLSLPLNLTFTIQTKCWTLNLILTLILKLSVNPQTSLRRSEDLSKCSHFPQMSSLWRVYALNGPHKDIRTGTHKHTLQRKSQKKIVYILICFCFFNNSSNNLRLINIKLEHEYRWFILK